MLQEGLTGLIKGLNKNKNLKNSRLTHSTYLN